MQLVEHLLRVLLLIHVPVLLALVAICVLHVDKQVAVLDLGLGHTLFRSAVEAHCLEFFLQIFAVLQLLLVHARLRLLPV